MNESAAGRWIGVGLAPLGWLYGAVAALRVAAYRRGWFSSERPPMPTLSIGNLAVGGTGKTPLLLATIACLERCGAEIGVLSRGYGGDEGRILEARHPRTRLIENPDRRAGLSELQRQGGAEVLLLDDGFQHLQLQRDLDVVVLDATRPFGRCLPAGLFRESARALRRADLVVVSRAELQSADHLDRIWRRVETLRRGLATLPRIEGGMHLRALRRVVDGREEGVEEWQGRAVHLAAGIGNPASFAALCRRAGLEIRSTEWRRDHHPWQPSDLTGWEAHDRVVVTEKDAVKLRPFAPDQLWETLADWVFTRGQDEWEEALNRFYLPVRASRIEPLWTAHDPDGRAVR